MFIFFYSSESDSDWQKPGLINTVLRGKHVCFSFTHGCVCVWCAHQARQCCDEGEYLLANQEVDKFQSKEDAQKTRQDIEHFLETALPFINCDPKALQYEFDVILSPELKVRSFFSSKHIFKPIGTVVFLIVLLLQSYLCIKLPLHSSLKD